MKTTEQMAAKLARQLKLRELRVFQSVADHGSFRRAAETLHISQPAITTTIAELEELLGVRLFDRSPKGIQLTLHGANFLRRAEAVFGELRLAAEDLQSVSDGLQGTLHIGTVPMPASGIVPATVFEMQERFPKVFISVTEANESTLIDALHSRRIDLLIARKPLVRPDDSLNYDVLYGDPLCVISGDHHPLAKRRKIQMDELMLHRWVMPSVGSAFYDQIRRVLAELNLDPPEHAVETLSIPVMYGMLSRGPYLAFATLSQVRFNPLRSFLRILPVKLAPIAAPICAVTLTNKPPSATAIRFIERLKSIVTQPG